MKIIVRILFVLLLGTPSATLHASLQQTQQEASDDTSVSRLPTYEGLFFFHPNQSPETLKQKAQTFYQKLSQQKNAASLELRNYISPGEGVHYRRYPAIALPKELLGSKEQGAQVFEKPIEFLSGFLVLRRTKISEALEVQTTWQQELSMLLDILENPDASEELLERWKNMNHQSIFPTSLFKPSEKKASKKVQKKYKNLLDSMELGYQSTAQQQQPAELSALKREFQEVFLSRFFSFFKHLLVFKQVDQPVSLEWSLELEQSPWEDIPRKQHQLHARLHALPSGQRQALLLLDKLPLFQIYQQSPSAYFDVRLQPQGSIGGSQFFEWTTPETWFDLNLGIDLGSKDRAASLSAQYWFKREEERFSQKALSEFFASPEKEEIVFDSFLLGRYHDKMPVALPYLEMFHKLTGQLEWFLRKRSK